MTETQTDTPSPATPHHSWHEGTDDYGRVEHSLYGIHPITGQWRKIGCVVEMPAAYVEKVPQNKLMAVGWVTAPDYPRDWFMTLPAAKTWVLEQAYGEDA